MAIPSSDRSAYYEELAMRLYGEITVEADRPGDAELRADRIVFGGDRGRWKCGVFNSYLVLKELIAKEIIAVRLDERARWTADMEFLLRQQARLEEQLTRAMEALHTGA